MPATDNPTDADRIRHQNRIRARRYQKRHKAKRAAYMREYRNSRRGRALKVVALATDYPALAAALAECRRDENMTQRDVDAKAFLADGQTSKLEIGAKQRRDGQPTNTSVQSAGRTAGPKTLYAWLSAFGPHGLGLVVVELPPPEQQPVVEKGSALVLLGNRGKQ